MPKGVDKHKKKNKHRTGQTRAQRYIDAEAYMKAFNFYIEMIENKDDKYKKPPENLNLFLAIHAENIANELLSNYKEKSVKDLYEALYYLQTIKEDLEIPYEVKSHLARHADKCYGKYFDLNPSDKPLNEQDPLILSLKSYLQKHKSHEKADKPKAILASIYSDKENPAYIDVINKRLKHTQEIPCRYLNYICADVKRCAKEVYQGDLALSKSEKRHFNRQMLDFLKNSKSIGVVQGLINDEDFENAQRKILENRAKIANMYLQNKKSAYRKEHWEIFSDIPLLLEIDNREAYLSIAIADAQENGLDIYKDKANWIPILLSGNQEAIEKLTSKMSEKDVVEFAVKFMENDDLPDPPVEFVALLSQHQNAIVEEIFKDRNNEGFDLEDAFYTLENLYRNNPGLIIPDEIKLYLAKNVDDLYQAYKNESKERDSFDENDPLIASLLWYTRLDLPRGSLNSAHSALMYFYSREKDASLLPQINEHLKACSFTDSEYLSWSVSKVKKLADAFVADIDSKTDEEVDAFNKDISEFLLLSSPNQRFIDTPSDEELEQTTKLRQELAKVYFNAKKVEFSREKFDHAKLPYNQTDWQILNDVHLLKSLDKKERESIIEVALHALEHDPKVKNHFYKDRAKWFGILLSDNVRVKQDLYAYIFGDRENEAIGYDMAYLARLHQQILYHDLSDKKEEHQAIADNLLRHAAVRGNKYAIAKLKSMPDESKALNDPVFRIQSDVEQIEKHMGFLYQAKRAKGIRRLQYLGLGSKADIEKKLSELRRTRIELYKQADRWIDDDSNPPPENMLQACEILRKKSSKDYGFRKTRYKALVRTFDVLSFGILPLRRLIKQTVANKLMDSATMKGSGYRYWDENYHAIVESMDGDTRACDALELKEGTKLTEAKEKVSQARERVEEAKGPAEEEKKTLLGRLGIRRTARKELEKAKKDLAFAEKLEYRAERNKDSAEYNAELAERFPGLVIEERTITTEDGVKLDVLVINNVHAQERNPGKVPDLIHFSGRGCFYKLDDRHFEHAVAKGCNLVVVQDRLTSANSEAVTASQESMARDGVAAVKATMAMREREALARGEEYNEDNKPIINGYCGGGPISVLTYEALQEEGIELKFLGDRTFRSLSGMLEGWFDGDSRAEKAKKAALQVLAKPALAALGWDVDVAQKIGKIPEDKKIYVDIDAPDDEKDIYYQDYTIDKSASVHTGLEQQRAKKREKIEVYHKLIEDLREHINGPNFNGSEQDRERILACIASLSNTLHYVHSAYDITQVKATEDDAHVEATSTFLLRDNTQHDEHIYEFIHNLPEDVREHFAPSQVNQNDPLKEILEQLWLQSGLMFNDFYDNGKKNVELKHADHDIRHRINALIYAINLHQMHNSPQFIQAEAVAKAEHGAELTLKQQSSRDFVSPDLPSTMKRPQYTSHGRFVSAYNSQEAKARGDKAAETTAHSKLSKSSGSQDAPAIADSAARTQLGSSTSKSHTQEAEAERKDKKRISRS